MPGARIEIAKSQSHQIHHQLKTTYSSAMSRQALTAYRHALRATRVAFNGDNFMLLSARAKVKESILANRNLSDEQETAKSVQHLDEVAAFLAKNIVQGEKQENDRYHLKFHAKTELGSNDTIKENSKANLGSLAGVKVRKCSDK
ncbi:hypothetical protein METBIDRAFT_31280 [Metschnikowia bicuspidata var. bicuspidata NRRL YB-4993]|uniref:Mitochondrial zinc maintenance protein 1, mitochondrial n=1 Tax=Metschnikowia bicuspidata var. bicuspidata NRRL YB-4993 TaxID=869754 RepID=A0A1A0HEF7_9ASCO|nr:hypothetical protein METBIDRAFT_31280 [Metschnikowia bicuspidata var. bicuspidata NRRL YB-4993]OBA22370.1 hypothetical protein METBIDRAFT_31280 [Metschnikowia bicuspidata var. bicuspidata NRRL YB-4993]